MIFGMALIYSQAGTMKFSHILPAVMQHSQDHSLFLLMGLALMVVGIGFKLAVVPFHLWTADVYQGAPAPVTAFVATVSKGAVVAVFLRFLAQMNLSAFPSFELVLVAMAVVSMFVGNWLALLQKNVKRMLAYSSIAHLGYVMVGLLVGGPMSLVAVTIYITVYSITILGAFGVISVLSRPDRETEELDDYRGLAWLRPGLAAIFMAMLLSLAGIPLTAGFIGKFYVAAAGVGARYWALIGSLVLSSAIGVYYYLRVIVAMFTAQLEENSLRTEWRFSERLVLGFLSVLLIGIGVYPTPLLNIIQTVVARLVA